ncbi:MAG: hypothetical protein DI616_02140 [Paracoccus denitrificans]|uniref:Sulfotransferase family protein n=1 Tax=Paracoccus denitrificans TaxID=266 RepID=A0A533ID60_PARDE|nr:MAG: hypothetical protein DI616_02140 [Paracoccus denitrificans]
MANPFRMPPRTLRRARIYAGRTRALAGGLKKPCLFMHMPKCGGTSLSEALYATVPLGQNVAVIDALSTRRAAAIAAFDRNDVATCHEDLEHGDLTFALREQLLLTHMAAGARLIHGHVLYSDAAMRHFGDDYSLVTLLREPVARAISNFAMMAGNGFVEPDVDAWLDGPVGRSHATVFLRYLSGQNVVSPADEGSALDLAKRRLEKFSVVGFLDDLPQFLDSFTHQFGTRPRIHRYNQAAWPKIQLNAAQRTRLEAACAADTSIYEFARAHFWKDAAA